MYFQVDFDQVDKVECGWDNDDTKADQDDFW